MLGVVVGYCLAGAMVMGLGYSWFAWIQRDRFAVSLARRRIAMAGLTALSAAVVVLLALLINALFPQVTDSSTLFRMGRWSWLAGVLAMLALPFGKGMSRVAALGVCIGLVIEVSYLLIMG